MSTFFDFIGAILLVAFSAWIGKQVYEKKINNHS